MAEISYSYIQVDSNNTVANISMFTDYENANKITRMVYGDKAFAEEYRYAVAIGDTYEYGKYYHTNEEGVKTPVDYIPSEADRIAILESDNKNLKDKNDKLTMVMADIIGGANNA